MNNKAFVLLLLISGLLLSTSSYYHTEVRPVAITGPTIGQGQDNLVLSYDGTIYRIDQPFFAVGSEDKIKKTSELFKNNEGVYLVSTYGWEFKEFRIWKKISNAILLLNAGVPKPDAETNIVPNNIDKKEALEKTLFWLGAARKDASEENVEFSTMLVRTFAKKANITLEGIGTSEDELKKLEIQGYVSAAKYWSNISQKEAKDEDVSLMTEWVREYAQKANVTLEEVGTSENELKKLEKQGYISEARHWYNDSKKNSGEEDVYATTNFVRKYARKANVTLEEVGTSENELKKLEKQGYVSAAKQFLELARGETDSILIIGEVSQIREYVQKAGVPLEEIGTTKEELQTLEDKANNDLGIKTISSSNNQLKFEVAPLFSPPFNFARETFQ